MFQYSDFYNSYPMTRFQYLTPGMKFQMHSNDCQIIDFAMHYNDIKMILYRLTVSIHKLSMYRIKKLSQFTVLAQYIIYFFFLYGKITSKVLNMMWALAT